MTVTLITPTRDRPKAFALCERWVARQDYTGEMEWVVVDDGDESVTCTMGQRHVRREPSQDRSTLPANLMCALRNVRTELVVIIEDDDWYAPNHVTVMAEELRYAPLAGHRWLNYYNVPSRAWKRIPNRDGCSTLAQTAFRAEMLPDVLTACSAAIAGDGYSVDGALWLHAPASHKRFTTYRSSVGIKGMGERPGLGKGHVGAHRWVQDPSGAVLREWIGDDADAYLGDDAGESTG